MKNLVKIILTLFVLSFINTGNVNADLPENVNITTEALSSALVTDLNEEEQAIEEISYIYFYGQGCSHCAKVDKYLSSVDGYEKLGIVKKEIYFDDDNREEMISVAEKLGLDTNNIGVPFLVINNNGKESSLGGDKGIINYFTSILGEAPENNNKTIVLAILAVLAVLIPVFLIKLSNKN